MSEGSTESLSDYFDNEYLEDDKKSDLDYWEPISQIILESIKIRSKEKLTQKDLAIKMETRQSVISRFENMGRLPNYDFISRLAIALGHSPGMTLFGEYMAVVSEEKQSVIDKIASEKGTTIKKCVQEILNEAIDMEVNIHLSNKENLAQTTEGTDTIVQNKPNIFSFNSTNTESIDQSEFAVAF